MDTGNGAQADEGRNEGVLDHVLTGFVAQEVCKWQHTRQVRVQSGMAGCRHSHREGSNAKGSLCPFVAKIQLALAYGGGAATRSSTKVTGGGVGT